MSSIDDFLLLFLKSVSSKSSIKSSSTRSGSSYDDSTILDSFCPSITISDAATVVLSCFSEKY
ncbi:hypothetical protein [Neodiprion abietis nucleopolyhedrovirus]|uniref:Uncharacterized protein n=1 Tax=Neodiprion abietis nucleopolyhedrovirus TaxID=204507 RepID=Q0ZP39_9CBAC|nr:hypothetical protein [Neodiprion abietis nucleopolyhedrovirus]ABC74915.1 unknown [Neodiprion abietis nucleopolyhedrovirus]